ncbi:MAG: chorismate-binding protein [Candidatus Omnitrophica bacterium]|nr:chorismate-binding protein [Candidatus Omnitrophota bacterium]
MKPFCVFLNEFSGAGSKDVLVFSDPVGFVKCSSHEEVPARFAELEKALDGGYYLAGSISYELGHYFLAAPPSRESSFPLFAFGIFHSPLRISLECFLASLPGDEYAVTNGHYTLPFREYAGVFSGIKDHLEKGNTYQVNLSFKYKFDLTGSPEAVFADMIRRQNAPYGSFVTYDEWAILSASPELFFRRNNGVITVRPMKGTIARGASPGEDDGNRRRLANSEKDRAENIMIVDLLRNDLGMISETGSVTPLSVFDIERYETLFQMTSTVRSTVKKGIDLLGLFGGMFPSGSVTGAPKKRTVEIIRASEKEERLIYTGGLGFISPSRDSVFSVAIRTVLLDTSKAKGEMGLGSGLVHGSDPVSEYEECLLKGKFFTGSPRVRPFSLLETMLWENGSVFLLDLHLKRLSKSAEYFSVKYDIGHIRETLAKETGWFVPPQKYRVRLLVDTAGNPSIGSSQILDQPPALAVKTLLSKKRTDKRDIFLYHKTTNRDIYDTEFSLAREAGFFDVLFTNSDDQLTEGAITNVLIMNDGEYFTPPLECGLLPGIFREHLLSIAQIPITEKVLYSKDLVRADKIFLMNSVRKLVPAILVTDQRC